RMGAPWTGASGATSRMRAKRGSGRGTVWVRLRPERSTVVTSALEIPGGTFTGTEASPLAEAVTGPKEAVPTDTRTRARAGALTRSRWVPWIGRASHALAAREPCVTVAWNKATWGPSCVEGWKVAVKEPSWVGTGSVTDPALTLSDTWASRRGRP